MTARKVYRYVKLKDIIFAKNADIAEYCFKILEFQKEYSIIQKYIARGADESDGVCRRVNQTPKGGGEMISPLFRCGFSGNIATQKAKSLFKTTK